MVVSFSKRLVFRACFHGPAVLSLPVHYFGRTLLCPGGEACPACAFSRPKRYHYSAATLDRKLEVVEMCDSLFRSISEKWEALQLPGSWSGLVVGGRRSAKRSMWTIDEFQFNDALKKTVAPKVLIDAVSQLYQLPINGHTELRPWVQAVITHHVPLLAKCVIVS